MNCREMLSLVDVLASEKNVEKDTVFGVLEAALASAVKKAQFPGEDADVVVHVDRVTGEFKAARRWLVVADEEELVCEIVVVSADSTRRPEHLKHLDNPARLDALEHRFGMVVRREILYNGRDFTLASGIAYRNLAKYLVRLGANAVR